MGCKYITAGVHFLLLVAFVSSETNNPGSQEGKCCNEKKVGDVLYTLVNSDNDDDTSMYGCNDDCVYKAEDDPSTRFCFKNGHLPVDCLDGEIVLYL